MSYECVYNCYFREKKMNLMKHELGTKVINFKLVLFFIFILSALLVGFYYHRSINLSTEANPGTGSIAVSSEMSLDEKVEAIMASMSKTEKLGQMVMIGIQGTDVTEDSLFMLHQYHIGGIVLFDRNMESKAQVANLNKNLQAQCNEKVPLFIAIDEEGGMVSRMKDDLIPPPSQRSIANSGDSNEAYKSAYNIANELKNMGFNVNFAPVADVGDGERNFSNDANTVAEFVKAAVDGYRHAGMLCSLKHFPGIGRGEKDTHVDSVVVNDDFDTIYNRDMLPFRGVISNQDFDNYMVMVSHVTYPSFAGNTPACISPVIIKGILRKELGYQGIIITDDLEMGAVSNYYGFDRIGVEAVKAGADIVMVCHEYQHGADVYLGLLDALKAGELTQEEVDNSVRRILKYKLQKI